MIIPHKRLAMLEYLQSLGWSTHSRFSTRLTDKYELFYSLIFRSSFSLLLLRFTLSGVWILRVMLLPIRFVVRYSRVGLVHLCMDDTSTPDYQMVCMDLTLPPPGLYMFPCRDDTTGFDRAVAALGDFTKDISMYYDPVRVG